MENIHVRALFCFSLQQLIECNYPCYSRDIALEMHLYLYNVLRDQ